MESLHVRLVLTRKSRRFLLFFNIHTMLNDDRTESDS